LLPVPIPESDWVIEPYLWRVGFHSSALPIISLLSGLVDILLTVYDESDDALVFIVRSLDQSGTLFNVEGGLRATKIDRYKDVEQDLMVQSPTNAKSSRTRLM